jgi:hypothetical protein
MSQRIKYTADDDLNHYENGFESIQGISTKYKMDFPNKFLYY